MKIIWSEESLERLTEIEEFIAQDSPVRAMSKLKYLLYLKATGC